MALLSTSNYFLALSCIATVLLWGVGAWNGSMMELLQCAWLGHFEDGTPLQSMYTGFFPIDFPIAILVAFFYRGTHGSDAEAQLFIFDVMANVQPGMMWFAIDSTRPESKGTRLFHPLAWGIMANLFGAGVIFPLYFMYYLEWERGKSSPTRGLTSVAIKTMPTTYLLSGVLPWILVGSSTVTRSATRHQQILAIFQLCPVWFSMLQMLGTSFLSDRRSQSAHFWTRTSHLVAAVPSAVAHLYVVGVALRSPAFSIKRMYIPHMSAGPVGANTLDLSAPWLFLQYDNIVITLSSISWAYLLLSSRSQNFGTKVLILLLLAGGAVVLGSGATVSVALFVREGIMKKMAKEKI